MSQQALVDTHCHLDFNVFNIDRTDVIDRAREAGVERMINPGIDLPTSRTAMELASQYPEVYAAVGVHPNEADSLDFLRNGFLSDYLKQDKVVAVGEIGLDFYRQHTPHDLQVKAFEGQLELSAQASLPVIVHNRDAGKEVLEILTTWQAGLRGSNPDLAKRPGVLHSFSGSIDEAWQALELGFLIGITGPVTFKNAVYLQRLVSIIPLDGLLVETDAPFLTPHPLRGKRNEPAYVRYTVEKIANLRGESVEHVAKVTTANAFRLFQWSKLF